MHTINMMAITAVIVIIAILVIISLVLSIIVISTPDNLNPIIDSIAIDDVKYPVGPVLPGQILVADSNKNLIYSDLPTPELVPALDGISDVGSATKTIQYRIFYEDETLICSSCMRSQHLQPHWQIWQVYM